MRKDYDSLKNKFSLFLDIWKTGDTAILKEIVIPDVHAHFSIVKNEPDCGQHSLYGVQDLFLSTPKTDYFTYIVGNYVCKENGEMAVTAAEVMCRAYNIDSADFRFTAQFCIEWKKMDDDWKMTEIRMDVKDYHSPLRDEFAKVWNFEVEYLTVSGLPPTPVILGNMDSPYDKVKNPADDLTEEEKIADTFYKFCYGLDWIIARYNLEVVTSEFQDGNIRDYIAEEKYERQHYRYLCHAYVPVKIETDGQKATGHFQTELPCKKQVKVQFVKEDIWKIASIDEEVFHA